MSEKKFQRRDVLKGALMGVAAVPVTALLGRAEAAAGKVDPSEPQAKSLGYVEDASKVDAKANPNFKPGQTCANCLQAPTAKAGLPRYSASCPPPWRTALALPSSSASMLAGGGACHASGLIWLSGWACTLSPSGCAAATVA